MNSLWKRFQFTRNQQRPPLKQSLRSQLNSNCTFSYDRDICRFVVLVILFRSFDWTEQRMTPSLVTVYDQRVSPDNGCACAIVILPDVLGCLICMIGQMRPGYGNWFQSISMVWRNRWWVRQNSDLLSKQRILSHRGTARGSRLIRRNTVHPPARLKKKIEFQFIVDSDRKQARTGEISDVSKARQQDLTAVSAWDESEFLSLMNLRPNNKIMSVHASLNLSHSIATVVKLGYCKSLRPFWLRASQGCGG